jgi:hypothetical protein
MHSDKPTARPPGLLKTSNRLWRDVGIAAGNRQEEGNW